MNMTFEKNHMDVDMPAASDSPSILYADELLEAYRSHLAQADSLGRWKLL